MQTIQKHFSVFLSYLIKEEFTHTSQFGFFNKIGNTEVIDLAISGSKKICELI